MNFDRKLPCMMSSKMQQSVLIEHLHQQQNETTTTKRLTSCFTFIEISEISFIQTSFRYRKPPNMQQLTVCESWFIYPFTAVVFKGPHIDLWTSFLPSLLKQKFLLFSYLRWALQGLHGRLVLYHEWMFELRDNCFIHVYTLWYYINILLSNMYLKVVTLIWK